MQITYFKVKNFKNIALAEVDNPPNFLVICGANGCGKTAILESIIYAKEMTASYEHFPVDLSVISADAEEAEIEVRLQFDKTDRDFYAESWGAWHEADWRNERYLEEKEWLRVRIRRSGLHLTEQSSFALKIFLSAGQNVRTRAYFDYIYASRSIEKRPLSVLDLTNLTPNQVKKTFARQNKFELTKSFLASTSLEDFNEIQGRLNAGREVTPSDRPDALADLKALFKRVLYPLEFIGVDLSTSPFRFRVQTPKGEIDIDDLSSGEKEILNTFVRFKQLRPSGAIILFDEPDNHLHPELQRRYLRELREMAKGNQMWITTHSAEMMMEAGAESLFSVEKAPVGAANQFARVSETSELFDALTDVLGSKGYISFRRKVVFIEGENASADREVYEHFYPPSEHNLVFVPAGNSTQVRMAANRVDQLLSAKLPFQQFYSIVDGDVFRPESQASARGNLFILPVYHVENFLLDEEALFSAVNSLLRAETPFQSLYDVRAELHRAVLGERHLNSLTKAHLDARVSAAAKQAYDDVFQNKPIAMAQIPGFKALYADVSAQMASAIADGSYRKLSKGREVLREFSQTIGVKYELLRNLTIEKLTTPPAELEEIMKIILS